MEVEWNVVVVLHFSFGFLFHLFLSYVVLILLCYVSEERTPPQTDRHTERNIQFHGTMKYCMTLEDFIFFQPFFCSSDSSKIIILWFIGEKSLRMDQANRLSLILIKSFEEFWDFYFIENYILESNMLFHYNFNFNERKSVKD